MTWPAAQPRASRRVRLPRAFAADAPRPAQRLALSALVAVAIACFAIALPAGVAAAKPSAPTPVRTVVVVLTPFLTWGDISASTPALQAALHDGALANMNSVTADPGWPTVAGGALSISASRWTAGPIDAAAEPSQLAAIAAANSGSLDPPAIGALGDAVHAAGMKTAAVGNADEDTSTPTGARRPAALMAMDHAGRVDLDFTMPALLASAPGWPFGVRSDLHQMRVAVRAALADEPSLLVVDPGDLERAHNAPAREADAAAAARAAAAAHAAAVRQLDGLVGDVRLALAGRSVLLMLVTPATDKPYYQPPYFGPTIVIGQRASGLLTCASTQRPGLVGNIDVAPTVLHALGLPPSSAMVGQPMSASAPGYRALGLASGFSAGDAVRALDRLGTSVGAVDYLRDLFFIRYFAWTALLVALLAGAVALVPALRRGVAVARLLLLFVGSAPAGAWLMFFVNRYPLTPLDALIAFAVATLGTFAVVVGLSAALHVRDEVPVLALATLASLLIAADQWTGRPYETGLFSYSIRAGWRYYGMGNEGAALLVGASILAVGLTCDLLAEGRWARLARLGLMPAVGAVVVVTAAAPFAGANAGVALWGLFAYGVAWLAVNRIRFTWKWALGLLGAIAVVVAAFALIDTLRGGAETHLGRFASELVRGDFGTIVTLVRRKAENNIGYLSQTPYTWLAVTLAACLAAVRWLGARPLARALAARPALAGALLGVVAGGAVALVTEDSGIVMPALMLLAGALPALCLALPRE